MDNIKSYKKYNEHSRTKIWKESAQIHILFTAIP